MNPGTRYRSQVCSTEVIVVRPAEVELSCGGHPMIVLDEAIDESLSLDPSAGDSALLGKRYTDAAGVLEVLVTKPGAGALWSEAGPLVLRQAKSLPSSD